MAKVKQFELNPNNSIPEMDCNPLLDAPSKGA